MRVLHVLRSGQFSGAENVACQIIKLMESNNIHSAYCSKEGPIRDALEERNIDNYLVPNLNLFHFYRVLREFKPDIIHAHDMYATLIASLSLHHCKIISHIHNSDFLARKVSVKSLLYLFASFRVNNIIWVSNSCFSTYRFHRIVHKKSFVLYNFVDVNEIYRKKENVLAQDNDIVFIGRLAEPKNPLRLIRIMRLVKQQCPYIKIAIVGTGELLEITKQKAEEYDLSSNIEFTGYLNNPFGYLCGSKVMVLTSDREGTPMIAMEAMALGIPIVSTKTDGLCELVKDGETGYLEDDEVEFANRVISIISDTEKQKMFRINTLARFKILNNLSDYKSKLENLYGLDL